MSSIKLCLMIKLVVELTRFNDLERQIDLSKLESSQAATSRRENEERLAALSENWLR